MISKHNMGWILIRNFCVDPDPELGKLKAGSGFGINHSGSKRLFMQILFKFFHLLIFSVPGKLHFSYFVIC